MSKNPLISQWTDLASAIAYTNAAKAIGVSAYAIADKLNAHLYLGDLNTLVVPGTYVIDYSTATVENHAAEISKNAFVVVEACEMTAGNFNIKQTWTSFAEAATKTLIRDCPFTTGIWTSWTDVVADHVAAVNPHPQYLRVWSSGEYGFDTVGGTVLNVNHGLTLDLNRAIGQVCYRCKVADATNGFAVGDIVTFGAIVVIAASTYSPPLVGMDATSIWSHVSFTGHLNTVNFASKTNGTFMSMSTASTPKLASPVIDPVIDSTAGNWVRFFKIYY